VLNIIGSEVPEPLPTYPNGDAMSPFECDDGMVTWHPWVVEAKLKARRAKEAPPLMSTSTMVKPVACKIGLTPAELSIARSAGAAAVAPQVTFVPVEWTAQAVAEMRMAQAAATAPRTVVSNDADDRLRPSWLKTTHSVEFTWEMPRKWHKLFLAKFNSAENRAGQRPSVGLIKTTPFEHHRYMDPEPRDVGFDPTDEAVMPQIVQYVEMPEAYHVAAQPFSTWILDDITSRIGLIIPGLEPMLILPPVSRSYMWKTEGGLSRSGEQLVKRESYIQLPCLTSTADPLPVPLPNRVDRKKSVDHKAESKSWFYAIGPYAINYIPSV
jgi:hypothetical protein